MLPLRLNTSPTDHSHRIVCIFFLAASSMSKLEQMPLHPQELEGAVAALGLQSLGEIRCGKIGMGCRLVKRLSVGPDRECEYSGLRLLLFSTWSTWSAGCSLVYPGRFGNNLRRATRGQFCAYPLPNWLAVAVRLPYRNPTVRDGFGLYVRCARCAVWTLRLAGDSR